MKLFKYEKFINEKEIDMLLESIIRYGSDFSKILNSIDSRLSKILINLSGKEIDKLKVNLININKDADDDIVSFTSGDDQLYAMVIDDGQTYEGLGRRAREKNLFDVKNPTSMNRTSKIGKIVKYLTVDDLVKISPDHKESWEKKYNNGEVIAIFLSDEGESLIDTIGLEILDTNEKGEKVRKTDIKIGRLIRKILDKIGEKYTDVEIEDFVNKYKSKIGLLKNKLSSFKVVSGEDIRKYYLSTNYESDKNTLGSSCMRYNNCQKYLDIYVENENVSLIIMESMIDNKICGRALLWTDNKGRKIMDRVYTNNNSDVELFIQYAKENNLYYKKSQNSNHDTPLLLNDVTVDDGNIALNVKRIYGSFDYKKYPYMDTLKYYDPEYGILANNYYEMKSDNFYYILESTSGGYDKTRIYRNLDT